MTDEQIRAAREVLWFYEPSAQGAWQPGGFGQKLIIAMTHADTMNLARLSTAFPEYARWVYAVKFTGTGLDELRDEVARADQAQR